MRGKAQVKRENESFKKKVEPSTAAKFWSWIEEAKLLQEEGTRELFLLFP